MLVKYGFRFRYSLVTLFAVVTLISVALTAYRFFTPPPPYTLPAPASGRTYFTYSSLRTYKLEITEDIIARSPKWDRRRSNPPVAANVAMIKADQVRKKLIAEDKVEDESTMSGTSWSFLGAQLTPFNDGLGQWYWVVRFQYTNKNSNAGPPDELQLVVLMDGSVLEPTIDE